MIDRVDWSWVLGRSQGGIFRRSVLSAERTTSDTCRLGPQELKERRLRLWLFATSGQWLWM
jgi:hypothetical protein